MSRKLLTRWNQAFLQMLRSFELENGGKEIGKIVATKYDVRGRKRSCCSIMFV
jgi:hypothetical protein